MPVNDDSTTENATAVVVQAALLRLQGLHSALVAAYDDSLTKQTLYTSGSRRLIDGLLDLISLEGIYPALSPGVGIPIERRVKSVLQGGVAARPVSANSDNGQSRDLNLLKKVIDSLSKIALAGEKGVNPALRERTLVDVICGCAELAYGPPSSSRHQNIRYIYLYEDLLDEYVLSFRMTCFLS